MDKHYRNLQIKILRNLDQRKFGFTWFNYFARGVLHHNLTGIKVLKCKLKST